MLADKATKHIQVYFITLDEDGTLVTKHPTKKGRAIVEVDLDGSYVLNFCELKERQECSTSSPLKSFIVLFLCFLKD